MNYVRTRAIASCLIMTLGIFIVGCGSNSAYKSGGDESAKADDSSAQETSSQKDTGKDDKTPPTVPGTPTYDTTSQELTWAASRDDHAVTYYLGIYPDRDEDDVEKDPSKLSLLDLKTSGANTTYKIDWNEYQSVRWIIVFVMAVDAAGNRSPLSQIIKINAPETTSNTKKDDSSNKKYITNKGVTPSIKADLVLEFFIDKPERAATLHAKSAKLVFNHGSEAQDSIPDGMEDAFIHMSLAKAREDGSSQKPQQLGILHKDIFLIQGEEEDADALIGSVAEKTFSIAAEGAGYAVPYASDASENLSFIKNIPMSIPKTPRFWSGKEDIQKYSLNYTSREKTPSSGTTATYTAQSMTISFSHIPFDKQDGTCHWEWLRGESDQEEVFFKADLPTNITSNSGQVKIDVDQIPEHITSGVYRTRISCTRKATPISNSNRTTTVTPIVKIVSHVSPEIDLKIN